MNAEPGVATISTASKKRFLIIDRVSPTAKRKNNKDQQQDSEHEQSATPQKLPHLLQPLPDHVLLSPQDAEHAPVLHFPFHGHYETISDSTSSLDLQWQELPSTASPEIKRLDNKERLRKVRQQKQSFNVVVNGSYMGQYKQTPDYSDYMNGLLLQEKKFLKQRVMEPESILALKNKAYQVIGKKKNKANGNSTTIVRPHSVASIPMHSSNQEHVTPQHGKRNAYDDTMKDLIASVNRSSSVLRQASPVRVHKQPLPNQQLPAPVRPLSHASSHSSFFLTDTPSTPVAEQDHQSVQDDASSMGNNNMLNTSSIASINVDEKNSKSKRLLDKLIRKTQKGVGFLSHSQMSNKLTVQFPAEEIGDSVMRLTRVRTGESMVDEIPEPPNMNQLFPELTLKAAAQNNAAKMLLGRSLSRTKTVRSMSLASLNDAGTPNSPALNPQLSMLLQQQAKHADEEMMEEAEEQVLQKIDSTVHHYEQWVTQMEKQFAVNSNDTQQDDRSTASNSLRPSTTSSAVLKAQQHRIKLQAKHKQTSQRTQESILKAGLWRARFVSMQIEQQAKLLNVLDERENSRESIYTSKEHLARVADRAWNKAECWHVSTPLKPAKQSIWTNANQKLKLEQDNLQKAVRFYADLMQLLDALNAPSTVMALQFLNCIREKLMQDKKLQSDILFAALSLFDKKDKISGTQQDSNVNTLFQSKDAIKILDVVRRKLDMSTQQFFDSVRAQEWKISNEMLAAKAKWQEAEMD